MTTKEHYGMQELGEKNGTNGISKDKEDKKPKSGLGIWTTALFVLGEMAGSGVLAMPKAMADAGYAGFALLVIFCVISGFAGARLGVIWNILEERWPEYLEHIQRPYPSMGFRAYGKWMQYAVSFCVDFSLFGVGVVYILLTAQLLSGLLGDYVDISPCIWILIVSVIMCPALWLGTPKDFWFMGILATMTTVVACILLIIQANLEKIDRTNVVYNAPTASTFFLAFGTILFSFGGASTFPTLQIDMKKRKHFPWAIIIGFIGLMCVYLPVAITGFYFFGKGVDSNVIKNLDEKSVLIKSVDVLLVVHLFPAFVIGVNPVAQELEGLFKMPNKFSFKRCAVRSLLMVGLVFVAESIPKFGKVLDLVGGSTITLLTFVFPPLFYMRMVDMKGDPSWPVRKIHIAERIFLWIMMLVGLCGGTAATYSALREIVSPDSMCVPCYIPGGGNCSSKG